MVIAKNFTTIVFLFIFPSAFFAPKASAHRSILSHCGTLLWFAGVQSEWIKSNAAPNPYLTEPLYAPVADEPEVPSLRVIAGKIPEDLKGTFLRNGPNPRFAPVDQYSWFDGDGYLHAVQFRDGVAGYRGRFIDTGKQRTELRHGKAWFSGLIQPVSIPNLFNLIRTGEPLPVTGNTAVVGWQNEALASHYSGGTAYRLNAQTLATQGRFSLPGRESVFVSAHPKVDPISGNLVFISGSPIRRNYDWVEVGNDGIEKRRTSFQLRRPFLMHDLAFTNRFGLVLDLPIKAAPAEPTIRHVAADRNLPGRIGLVPRKGPGGEVRWIEVAPGVVLHVVNAYDLDDKVVLRAIQFQDKTLGGYLHEWELDPVKGTATERHLSDIHSEFPKMNDQHFGQPAQFAYVPGLAASRETFAFEHIAKHDFKLGTEVIYRFGNHRYGSEPIFVARSGGVTEDDGYLLTLVSSDENGFNSTAEMVILDARDLSVTARIAIPLRIPYGFHAAFIPSSH